MTIKTYPAKYLIYCTLLFLSSVTIGLADASMYENLNIFDKNNTKQSLMAAGEKGNGSSVQTRSHLPLYTEILLTSISGEIYLNPKYIGRIISVTPLRTGTSTSSESEIEFNQTKDLWPVVIVPQSMSDLEGLNLTGEEGSMKISRSGGEQALENNELKSITKPKIAFGQLSSTILFTETNVNNPSKFEIGVFDSKDNKFINGDIIALTNNQMAAKFEDLPLTVISKDGKLRYSLKEQDGSFINSDTDAWGCELLIPDTEIGKSVPIKAQIFGLPDESKVKFTFQPVEGQKFSLPVSTLSVKEINSGEPITMISTSINGNQLISVTVEEAL
ncbi:MAG TPA: hypothetical protein VGA95_05180 [Thermodesulfobacteriota bacterium]